MGRFSEMIVTCEHGGNEIPARYERGFRGCRKLLTSHRGWDAGALTLASEIARELDCALISAKVSRLLVDLNRSLTNPRVFSEASRRLSPTERADVVNEYYNPYRHRVESAVGQLLAKAHRVLHLSVHSFTPILNGCKRNADIGLLYDPARGREREFCLTWQRLLKDEFPELCVRRNYPYRGKDDGLTTSLRKSMPVKRYLGIELEINQRWVHGAVADWRRLRTTVIRTLQHMRNRDD